MLLEGIDWRQPTTKARPTSALYAPLLPSIRRNRFALRILLLAALR
jgi:hypothetical protein